MKITKANIGNCKSIKTLEFKPSSNHRFPDRKLSPSSNKYEKLYEALWDDTLELRKKAGVMVSILGIILPLLITLYVNNQSTLNFDSNLFTIFFGTCLLIFIQYFGLFICLYNVPKYGIDWGNIDLDDLKILDAEEREEIQNIVKKIGNYDVKNELAQIENFIYAINSRLKTAHEEQKRICPMIIKLSLLFAIGVGILLI